MKQLSSNNNNNNNNRKATDHTWLEMIEMENALAIELIIGHVYGPQAAVDYPWEKFNINPSKLVNDDLWFNEFIQNKKNCLEIMEMQGQPPNTNPRNKALHGELIFP